MSRKCSYKGGNLLKQKVQFKQQIRSVYKELHADHETGAADNK